MYSSTTALRIAALRSSRPVRSIDMVTSGYRGGASALVDAEGGDERLLGDLDAPDVLHPLLARLLLLQQLALAGDVAAVALGQHVLALGLHGLPGDDPAPDGGLDGDVEHLPRDQLPELGGHLRS